MRSIAQEIFAPTAGERLLDAGCGVGEVARELAAAVGRTGSVVALDSSAEMIAAAESQHDGTSVSYQTRDIRCLDFPTGYFSGVRSERMLQHSTDAQAAVEELARVTEPGGRVCIIGTDWTSLTHDGFDGIDGLLENLAIDSRDRQPGPVVPVRMWKAGLRSVITRPVTLRFTAPDDAAPVMAYIDGQLMSGSRCASGDVFQRFWAAATEAVEHDRFLLALTLWITQGRVPAGRDDTYANPT